MRKPPKYYLKNISRRWQTEIKKVDDKIIILSPYLTSKTAEAVLRGSKFTECEIYTIFSVHNFVSGASSLKTLKKLYQRGCKLYHLPRLHAKIVLAPGRFATIGSQNLTRNGVKNKEASVITFDKEEVEKIEKRLARWLPQRKSITLEMLNEIEAKITDLRRKFSLVNRELRKEINELENNTWENEFERIENERLAREAEERRKAEEEAQKLREAEERRKAEEEAQKLREAEERRRAEEEAQKRRKAQLRAEIRKQWEEEWKRIVNLANARQRVQQLSTHGEVDEELAKEFIRKSAYWKKHPKSHKPARAPKHATHIYGSPDNWRIDFGANSFLVGLAIYSCQQDLLDFIDKAESGYVMPMSELRERLKLIIQSSVANHNGDKYNGYYSAVDDNFMLFGVQAINIDDFVNLVLEKAKLDVIFQ